MNDHPIPRLRGLSGGSDDLDMIKDWPRAARDLALATSLSITEAAPLVLPFSKTSLEPSDVVVILDRLVMATSGISDPGRFGTALLALVRLAS